MEWLIFSAIVIAVCVLDWIAREALAALYIDQHMRRASEAVEKQRQAREACKEAQRIAARNQERTK